MNVVSKPLPPLTSALLDQSWEAARKLIVEQGGNVDELLHRASENVERCMQRRAVLVKRGNALNLDDAGWRALMIDVLSPLATKPLTHAQLESVSSPIVSIVVGHMRAGESKCADETCAHATCDDDACGSLLRDAARRARLPLHVGRNLSRARTASADRGSDVEQDTAPRVCS